jgi:hypothetical protein
MQFVVVTPEDITNSFRISLFELFPSWTSLKHLIFAIFKKISQATVQENLKWRPPPPPLDIQTFQ